MADRDETNRAPVEPMEIEPDFTDQPLSTDGLENAGVELSEDDDVFFPPTDPVITSNSQGDIEVLGGFSATSDQSVQVKRSADGTLGDEAIEEAVRRELMEDAATTALRLDVSVVGGVVRLRGTVDGIEDVENAEGVAARVPGVTEVIEELQVP